MTNKILYEALGDRKRDFKKDPLTQEEIQAVICHCKNESKRRDLDGDLKELYLSAIEVLMSNVEH